MVKRLSCAVTLIMLACAAASAHKFSGMNKATDVTLKRGVVGDTNISQWINSIRNKSGNVTLKRGVVGDNGFSQWENGIRNKSGDVTLKRGVVDDNSFSQWESSIHHSQRYPEFELLSTHASPAPGSGRRR